MKKVLSIVLLTALSFCTFNVSASDDMVTCMAIDCVQTPPMKVQQDVENLHMGLSKNGMRFYLMGKTLKIEIPARDLYQKVDERAALKKSANDKLRIIGEFMSKYPRAVVTVVGHTGLEMDTNESVQLTKLQAHGVALNLYHRNTSSGMPTVIGKGNLENDYCSEMNQGCNEKIDVLIENVW
jgi:hypothetical protein